MRSETDNLVSAAKSLTYIPGYMVHLASIFRGRSCPHPPPGPSHKPGWLRCLRGWGAGGVGHARVAESGWDEVVVINFCLFFLNNVICGVDEGIGKRVGWIGCFALTNS